MRHYNKGRIISISVVWIVLLAVIISIFTPVRDIVLNHLFPTSGVPTATIPSGDNLFYIQASPPGHILIDGHPITHLPDRNKQPHPDTPLQLAQGKHQIVWESAPFQPLICAISVPSQIEDQHCPYETLIQGSAGQNIHLITFTPSFQNLTPAQQQVLGQHIQNVLQTLNATAPVLPGEQYFYTSLTGETSVVTARQPIQASVAYHLETSVTSQRDCIDGYSDACNYNGQNCIYLCVLTQVASISGGGETFTPVTGPDWYTYAIFYPTWTYRTINGILVAGNQSEFVNRYVGIDHSVLLHLLWKDNSWAVNIVPSFSQLNITSPDPACAALSGLVHSLTTYGITHDSQPKNIYWNEYVGPNRAAGCLGVATTQHNAGPQGYFLYRFGVLLAANAAAHGYFPDIPLADSYEQAIAQQIANQAGV